MVTASSVSGDFSPRDSKRLRIAVVMPSLRLAIILTTFTFIMLSSRTNMGFVPLRDHAPLIASASEIDPSE